MQAGTTPSRPPGMRRSRRSIGLAVAAATTALLLAVPAGGASATPAPTSPCAAVHVIAARASTEPPGAGIIGSLVTLIQNGVSATVSTAAVDYPATLTNYAGSTTQGDAAIKRDLTDEVTRCPSQRIVLVGYSQGAQLVGDVLGGGGGAIGLGPATPPVSAEIGAHVVAVIQMGDPRHMPNKPFNQGTARRTTGLFPRGPNQSLDAYAPIIQSYCDLGDPFCAGGVNLAVHLTYTDRYNDDALSFVVGRLNAAGVS